MLGRSPVRGLLVLVVVTVLCAARGAGAADAPKIGDRVQVKLGENWVDATVTNTEGQRVRAKIGPGVESWFGAGDYRAAAAGTTPGKTEPAKPQAAAPPKPKPIVVGQKVLYEQARYWKPGTVTAREATRVKVKPEIGVERWFELKDVTPAVAGDDAFFASLSEGAEVLAQDNIGWLKAEVLAREPGRVKIHYVGWSDAWDTWLGQDKVRPLAGGAAGRGGDGSAVTTTAGTTTVERPAVPGGDLAGVRQLKTEKEMPAWAVKPDPAPEPAQKPAAGPLPLGLPVGDRDVVEQVVFAAAGDVPAATVVIVEKDGPWSIKRTRVVRVAMGGAKAPERVDLPDGVRFMGVSQDGARVVTRLKVAGLANCVQISTFAGGKLTPTLTWRPYKEDAELSVAQFVDGGHVVTCDKEGYVILWKLPEQAAAATTAPAATQAVVQPKAVYRLKVGNQIRPVLSPGRRVLAAEGFGTVRFFDVMTGAPLGGLEQRAQGGTLSFKGDGTQMVWVSGTRMTLIDTASGRTLREIPLTDQFTQAASAVAWGGSAAFLPGGYLLLGHRYLVAPSARLVVWEYRVPGASPVESFGGTTYFVAPLKDGTGNAALCSAKLPHDAAIAAVSAGKVRLDDLLIFRPGTIVQLEIATDAPGDVRQRIQASFERQFKAMGVLLGPGGGGLGGPVLRVRVSSENGETKPITYRIIGRGEETVSEPGKTHKVTAELDGKVVWSWEGRWAPSMMVMAKKGQTLADAVREDATRSYEWLTNVVVPADAVRAELYKVQGQSAVGARGVEGK